MHGCRAAVAAAGGKCKCDDRCEGECGQAKVGRRSHEGIVIEATGERTKSVPCTPLDALRTDLRAPLRERAQLIALRMS